MSDMLPSSSPDAAPAAPPEIRFLKTLVTALTGTMILGLVTIVALFVIRLPGGAVLPDLPATITLPAGEAVEALTFGKGYTIVVTASGRVLIYRANGTLAQELALQ